MSTSTEPWRLLRAALDRSHGNEDMVQEAVFRVWLRLGNQAAFCDCVRLGRKILRELRIDASRRRPLRHLGHDDDAVPAPEQQPAADPWEPTADARLCKRLGDRAVELIEYLLAGVRQNKVLATRMHTSPAAIRRRRFRIARILAEHLANGCQASGRE